MNNINKLIAVALTALAMFFTFSSCTKKADAPKGDAKKGSPAMTSEQAKQMEKIKKGVEESKNIVIARVNGAEITMYDLVKEMNAVALRIVPQGQPSTPEITAKVKKEALNSLIFRELAVQEAIRQGLKVGPEAIDDVIGKIKKQAGSDEAYKKYLEERGVDEKALRKIIERSHLLERITAREIFEKIQVDDRTLRDAYEKEKASFMTKDTPPRQLSFEEVKDFLVRKIKSERGGKKMAEWDGKLRNKAKIEVMN